MKYICLNYRIFYLQLNILRHQPLNLNITNYINFSSASTRSSVHGNNKLIPPHHLISTSRHSYFYWLPSLWNAMPVFDFNMSFGTLKSKLKKYLWEHFFNHFNDNNNCTLHYLCRCSECHQSRPCTIDLNHL